MPSPVETLGRSRRLPRSIRRGADTIALVGILALGASVVLTAACSSPFDSCEARRTCPPDPDAGGAGEGGANGSPNGDGGSDSSTAGTAGTWGTISGGSGGNAASSGSGGSGAVSATGGTGGNEASAGAGGSDSPPAPSCDEGERACGLPGTPERRVCRDGAWTEEEPCASGTVCTSDSDKISCLDIATGCEDKRPGESFCDGGTSVQCSDDLTEVTEKVCEEACEDGECVAATCGDGEVQGAEQCDDANDIGGDGCTNSCQWGPKQLVLGSSASCAIFGNGWAKCWGHNHYGQLGTGDTQDRGDGVDEMGKNLPFIEVNGVPGVFSALAVAEQACGVSDGALWCWGDNVPLASSPALRPVRVDVGGRVKTVVQSFGKCALLESGQVKCWGDYVLGYSTKDVPLPVGDQPSELGTNLRPVDLSEPAIAIDGGSVVCALLQSGRLECWAQDGTAVLELGPNRRGDGLPCRVDLGEGVKNKGIAVGSGHACALSSAGLKCWGYSPDGALGYGVEAAGTDAASIATLPLVPVTTSSDPIVSAHSLGHGMCVVLRSSSVKCWGSAGVGGAALGQPALAAAVGNIGDAPDEMSQLGPIDLGTTERILSFDSGDSHACALFESGQIKCWGYNYYGQLGLGHRDAIGDQEEEMSAGLRPTIVQ